VLSLIINRPLGVALLSDLGIIGGILGISSNDFQNEIHRFERKKQSSTKH